MKIPFNIKYRPQIESGEYKLYCHGCNIRIVCWDADKYLPLVVIINGTAHQLTIDCVDKRNTKFDLFVIIPESELTELEKAIKRGMLCAGLQGVSTTIIKETAKEVKDIICRGCTVGLDQYWKGRDDARKEYEKPITFYYPTYQPPCFHGGICTNPFKDCTNCPMHSSGATTNTTSGTCKKEE